MDDHDQSTLTPQAQRVLQALAAPQRDLALRELARSSGSPGSPAQQAQAVLYRVYTGGDGGPQRKAQALFQRYEQMERFNPGMGGGTLRCTRCKKYGASWDVKQTRSADEGATVFVQCAHCNKRYKL